MKIIAILLITSLFLVSCASFSPPKAEYMQCVKQHPDDHEEKCKELKEAWEKEKADRKKIRKGAEVVNEVIGAVLLGSLLLILMFSPVLLVL